MNSESVSSSMDHAMHMMSTTATSTMASMTSHVHDTASSTMTGMAGMASMAESATTAAADHGSMDMGGMHMYFTTNFKDYPVVFKGLAASNSGEAFGIFVLLFFVAIFARLLVFGRVYLEEVVWNTDSHSKIQGDGTGVVVAPALSSAQSCDGCGPKFSSEQESTHAVAQNKSISTVSSLFREFIKLILFVIPDIFSYGLMLAVMTYTLTYFFAVAVGSGVGNYLTNRLIENYRLSKPHGSCC